RAPPGPGALRGWPCREAPAGASGAQGRRGCRGRRGSDGWGSRDGAGEVVEQRQGLVEGEAGVGDALAEGERAPGGQVLAAAEEVALEHDAADGTAIGRELGGDVDGDVALPRGLLLAVAVAG